MKYNPYDRPTSLKLQHRYSWNIKNASFNLPMLDILNRNYPSIIKDRTNCILCNSAIETNEHIWRCTVVMTLLHQIFQKHRAILIKLLEAHTTKLSLLVNDTVKYTRLFKWTYKNFDPTLTLVNDHPIMLLIRNYVPCELTSIFTAHFNRREEYKKILLQFLYNLHLDIYQQIWKLRSEKWKERKKALGIRRTDFTSLKRKNKRKRSDNDSDPLATVDPLVRITFIVTHLTIIELIDSTIIELLLDLFLVISYIIILFIFLLTIHLLQFHLFSLSPPFILS
jgi:hypothetical protein